VGAPRRAPQGNPRTALRADDVQNEIRRDSGPVSFPYARHGWAQQRCLQCCWTRHSDAALAGSGAVGSGVGRHLSRLKPRLAARVGWRCRQMRTPAGLSMFWRAQAAMYATMLWCRFVQLSIPESFPRLFPERVDLIVRAAGPACRSSRAIEDAGVMLAAPVSHRIARWMLGEDPPLASRLEDAVQDAAERIPVPDFRFFVASLLSAGTGEDCRDVANLSTIFGNDRSGAHLARPGPLSRRRRHRCGESWRTAMPFAGQRSG